MSNGIGWWAALRRPAFVLGTGRSGTHWIARSLAAHPDIRATIEAQPIFRWSTRIALDPGDRSKLLPRLVWAYRLELLRSAPRLYLDKSHPNIWIAEDLQEAFRGARFLGMEREPYATVASMMRHRGVADWHRRWREFPVPNRFLGIDEQTAETYDRLSLAARCALRWKAHHERMAALPAVLGDGFLLVRYEDFAADARGELARMQDFLGLRRPFPMPDIRSESLGKWRNHLTDADIEAIRAVVRIPPPVAAPSTPD